MQFCPTRTRAAWRVAEECGKLQLGNRKADFFIGEVAIRLRRRSRSDYRLRDCRHSVSRGLKCFPSPPFLFTPHRKRTAAGDGAGNRETYSDEDFSSEVRIKGNLIRIAALERDYVQILDDPHAAMTELEQANYT